MPRTALSQDQVDDFRDALCDEATRLFAEQGYEGVTMRALAKALGCSAMTPYRYFENKAEIFETVRSAGADRFADAIEAAVRAHRDHRQRLRAMCLAYVDFAVAEPHAYRIMFELDYRVRSESRSGSRSSSGSKPRDHGTDDLRGWRVMHAAVTEAIDAGVLAGDPEVVAHLLWSGVHGIVALHLSGMLGLGLGLEALVDAFITREIARGGHSPVQYDLPSSFEKRELSSDS